MKTRKINIASPKQTPFLKVVQSQQKIFQRRQIIAFIWCIIFLLLIGFACLTWMIEYMNVLLHLEVFKKRGNDIRYK